MSAIGRLITLAFGRGFGSLRANVGLGLLSLALAVSLWAFVTEEENPTRTDFFAGAIPVETVNVPDGLAVASLSEAAVSVRVSAPEDTWDDLTVEDFRAVADLSIAKARENTVALRFSSDRREVEVVEVKPATVTVILEPVATKAVPVTVKVIGAPPLGYSTDPGRTTPDQVEVTGPESLVALVEEAVADVNVQGVRVSLEQAFSLVPRDARSGNIEGVTLNPDTVEVVLPIVQREITQVFVVTPLLRGAPSDGFDISSVSVNPPFAVLTGSIEALQSVTLVATDEVDIGGATSDVARATKLRLPSDLTVVGSDVVTVQISISPAQGEITVGVTPTVEGLDAGLRANLGTNLVEVRVAGQIPELRELSPAGVTAVVDVSGLQEGEHTVPVQVTLPPGLQVAGVEPATVLVILEVA